MGYISNPIGLRLGKNRSWLVKGTDNLSHYSEDMYSLFKRLCYSFFRAKRFQRLGFIFSHIIFYPKNNGFNLFVFIYDMRSQQIIFDRRLRGLRKHWYTELRLPFYYVLEKRINTLFAISSKSNPSITTTILPITNKSLTARVIAEYSLRKLKAKNRLNEIFYPLIRGLRYLYLGMRIICQGRFTRNQRATKAVYSFGKVSLNTFNQKIDYQFMDIPLKFGVGSIKVFLSIKK